MEEEKLKTLKDFRDSNRCPICDRYLQCPEHNSIKDEYYWIDHNDIKAEAVRFKISKKIRN